MAFTSRLNSDHLQHWFSFSLLANERTLRVIKVIMFFHGLRNWSSLATTCNVITVCQSSIFYLMWRNTYTIYIEIVPEKKRKNTNNLTHNFKQFAVLNTKTSQYNISFFAFSPQVPLSWGLNRSLHTCLLCWFTLGGKQRDSDTFFFIDSRYSCWAALGGSFSRTSNSCWAFPASQQEPVRQQERERGGSGAG